MPFYITPRPEDVAKLSDGQLVAELVDVAGQGNEMDMRDAIHVYREEVLRRLARPRLPPLKRADPARAASEGHKAWLRGFAAALGAVQRFYDRGTIVAEVMKHDGVTLADLKAAGVEAFDLDPIKQAGAR